MHFSNIKDYITLPRYKFYNCKQQWQNQPLINKLYKQQTMS